MRTDALRTETYARRSACPVQDVLNDVFKRLQRDRSGEVASYIPELRKANPEWFAACLVTADGKIYEVGEIHQTFTIQSISKPFVYGMAIEDNGRPEVLKKVWVEPSGEAFNAISLRPGQGQPDNPMINAGAIATTSLVEGGTARQKICRILGHRQVCWPASPNRSSGLSVREPERGSQPRDRLYAQELQYHRVRSHSQSGCLFYAVLDFRDMQRFGRNGGDAR
jgi:glutaminase